MPSFLSWVDNSAAERQRMRQAVALFDESDTRDELGIGSIRDAFADELFREPPSSRRGCGTPSSFRGCTRAWRGIAPSTRRTWNGGHATRNST
jgi:hypothetical protein